MRKKGPDLEPIQIDTHEDLLAQKTRISRRMNDNPELARLVIVNPILAFEDLGVRLSPIMQRHVMHTLRFPKRLVERKKKLEAELTAELKDLGVENELPLSPRVRAQVLFSVLKLQPAEQERCDCTEIDWSRTKAYAKQHPLAAKLAEYERVRQGGLIFYPKETYQAYKDGRKQHRWLGSLRFKV